jgi:hypothetical protein
VTLYNLRYIINIKAQIEADSEDAARAVLADILDDRLDLLPGDYVDIVSCEQHTPTHHPQPASRAHPPMQPRMADPLAEAIARTILRHQLGCDQPAQPPAWMVAAANKIASAILPYLMDHTERDDLATEINRRTQA